MLTAEQVDLLENGLGLVMKEAEIDANDMWQHKPIQELKGLGNKQLKTICEKYGCPILKQEEQTVNRHHSIGSQG